MKQAVGSILALPVFLLLGELANALGSSSEEPREGANPACTPLPWLPRTSTAQEPTERGNPPPSPAGRRGPGERDEPGGPPTKATVRLHVLDEDSNPIQGIQVLIHSTPAELGGSRTGVRLQRETTDADGVFEVELDPSAQREFTVGALPKTSRETVTLRTLIPGRIRIVEVRLETRDDGVLHGRVLDDGNGSPLADIEIHARPAPRGFGGPAAPLAVNGTPSVVTGADGSFVLPTRSWCPSVGIFVAPGWSPQLVELAVGEGERPIEIRMDRSVTVRGTVTAEAAEGLRVVAEVDGNELVTRGSPLRVAPNPVLFQAVVDQEGRYVLEDLPSRTPLDLSVRRGRDVLRRGPRTPGIAPGDPLEVSWTIGSGSTVRGTLVESNGDPAPNAPVWLLGDRDSRSGLVEPFERPHKIATSDELGRFSFDDVSSGSWWIAIPPSRARSEDPSRAIAPMAVQIDVPEDGSSVETRLVQHRGLYIRGQVVDPGGKGISGRASANAETAWMSQSTDPEGRFRLGPLIPGTYSVQGSGRGNALLTSSDRLNVEAGGEDVVLRLRLGASLSMTSIDAESGKPAPARFVVSSDDGYLGMTMESRGRNSASFPSLAPSTYHVAAATSDGRVGHVTGLVLEAGTELEDMDITVAPGGHVSLRYRGPKQYEQFRVLHEGVVYSADGIANGSKHRAAVPVGRVEVKVGDQVRVVEVGLGDELSLEFDFDR